MSVYEQKKRLLLVLCGEFHTGVGRRDFDGQIERKRKV
jgi:hypothetical protein